MVNTYTVQSAGCRFESLWGFGFNLKGAHYEVDYCGKKTYLAGLQCTLTSSCAKTTLTNIQCLKCTSKTELRVITDIAIGSVVNQYAEFISFIFQ